MLKIWYFCNRLVAVLQKALDATTKTNKMLRESCDATQHLLSNWHIPDVSIHEQPPDCKCDDNDQDIKITEVAKNIEQVVEQAHKLRETLSVSQTQPKSSPLTKRSNKEKISSKLGFGSVKLNAKEQKKTQYVKVNPVNKPQATSNGSLTVNRRSVNNHSVAKRRSTDNCSPRATMTSSEQQYIPIPVNGNYDKKTITKPRQKSSPSFQTTYQKDFSVRTNCNTARYSPAMRSSLKPKESSMKDENTVTLHCKNTSSLNVKNMENNPKTSSGISLPEKIGISDLDDLLCQVTVYPNITVDPHIKNKKISQVKVNSCPLHDDKRVHTSNKACRVVGLAEAVDVFGVPSELVKVLKTYHYFLAESEDGMKHGSGGGKRQAAATRFLNKLSTTVS
jgi:hypothetical protein